MPCTDLLWRLAVALLTAFVLFVESLSADVRTLEARPVQGDIVLDGFLNEPAWERVPVATGFTQREPAAGAAATEPTEVRVAFTPAMLYVGIRALDSEPRAVTAKEMRNDAPLSPRTCGSAGLTGRAPTSSWSSTRPGTRPPWACARSATAR